MATLRSLDVYYHSSDLSNLKNTDLDRGLYAHFHALCFSQPTLDGDCSIVAYAVLTESKKIPIVSIALVPVNP